MDTDCEALIEAEFRNCVMNTIDRLEGEDTHRPFHAALLSDRALFWSRFERSFSTSFGQRVIEQVSKAAATSGGADSAGTQKETLVTLQASQLAGIEDHISSLRSGKRAAVPLLDDTVATLRAARATGGNQRVRVISDLWWRRDGINHYMSIKTVKPNLDQTAEAKRDLLKLKLADPIAKVYFGLYYNPFGENRAQYSWSFPKRIFNMATDSCVLIGKDYWDTLGGPGFYMELLTIATRVGAETRKQIEALR